MDEDGPLAGEGNPYCETKIGSERAVMALNAPPNFGVIVIRPGDVYGAGSLPWIVRPLDMLGKRRLFLPDGGRGVINHVYVDNLVDGIFLAIDARAHGKTYNITDGTATSFREFFGRVAARAGLEPPRFLPTGVMKAGARMVELLREWGITDDEASVDTVRYLTRPHAYSIERARRELGYEPRIDLEAGLARTQSFIDAQVVRMGGRRP